MRKQLKRPRSRDERPRRVYVFKPTQTVRQDAACSFCRLLAASISASQLETQSVASLTIYQDGVGPPSQSFKHIGVRHIAADVAGSLKIMPLSEDAEMIGAEPGNYGRMFEGNIANRNLMRSWLHRCIDSHTACQEIEGSVRRRMRGPKRLLNTKTMCVELANWESRYMALSYVWGGVPQPSVHGFGNALSKPDSFPVQAVVLPRTIIDAIRLTNELGETYLWVDLLCIDQDNPTEKAAEIAQMNEVYLAATATIVALCSNDANSGLPGVEEYCPPRAQRIESFEGIRFTTVYPSPSEILSRQDCTWNGRIWTMQEHLLSRRLLFLGSEQAYFSCSRSSYSEDRYESDQETYEVHQHPGGVLLDAGRKFGDVPWYVWKTYAELYSTRNGSVDADRFLAFQGILNEQQRNGKISFAEGLDINHLPLALYWWHGSDRESSLLVQSRRLSALPSWSWVGWSGQVCFPDIYHYRPAIKNFLLRTRAGDRLLWYDKYGKSVVGHTEQDNNHTTSSPSPTVESNDQPAHTQGDSSVSNGQQQPTLVFEGRCITVDSRCTPSTSLKGCVQVSAHQALPIVESHWQSSPINPPSSTSTVARDSTPNCICVLLATSPIWSSSIYLYPSFSFQSTEVPPKTFSPNVIEELALSRYRNFFDKDELYARENISSISTLRRMGIKYYSLKTRRYSRPLEYLAIVVLILVVLILGLLALVVVWACWWIISYFIRHVLAAIFPDFFSIAHLLRLEDMGNGFYERRGVQEMHYTKFKRLKPEVRTIKLV